MAGIRQTDQSGAEYVFENGAYRQVTETEEAIINESGVSVFSRSALNLTKSIGAIAQGVRGSTPGIREQGFKQLQQIGQEQSQLEQFSPLAAGLGSGAAEVLGGFGAAKGAAAIRAAGAVGGVVAPVSRRSALRAATLRGDPTLNRAATRRASTLQDTRGATISTPSPTAPKLVQDTGRLLDDMSVSTAGAAETSGFFQALKRVPKFRDSMEGMENLIGTKRPMTKAQTDMIARGDVERVGLQLLPGQRNGNGVIAEGLKRDPFIADAFDPILSHNSDQLAQKAARSMGLESGDYGRDIRELGRISVGDQFKEVEAGLGQIDASSIAKQLTDLVGDEVLDFTDLQGADAMRVRGFIAEELSGLQKQAALPSEVRKMEKIMDAYDDIIEGAMDDPALKQTWSDARSRWRVVRAFDRQGVITQDGDISLKTLVNALEREFVKEFRRTNMTGGNLPGDVTELLDFARVARSFTSNMNDSGTATGNSILGAVGNPIGFARKRLTSAFITNVLL